MTLKHSTKKPPESPDPREDSQFEPRPQTGAWFANAIIYHLLIDRFAGTRQAVCEKPEPAGGSLRALAGMVDYIADLGFNTIWISPFYEAVSYHGYDITDYRKINPAFGTLDDLRQLIADCRSAGVSGGVSGGVRVIADFVPNHCSAKHPFFLDAKGSSNSRYRDWFHFDKRGGGYASFMGYANLPRLNLRNREAREHIIEAALFWLDQGLAGFRLDHAVGPPHEFWIEFRDRVKRDHPEAVLIGEAPFYRFPFNRLNTIGLPGKWRRCLLSRLPFVEGDDLAARAFVGVLDGCLDFTFQRIVLDNLRRSCTRPEAAARAKRQLERHYRRFPKGFYLPTFLDHHDCNRFLYEFRGDQSRENLKSAATLQFEIDQPPIVYYGTEIGMTQAAGIGDQPHHGDNLARQPMIWDENEQDQGVKDFYRKLIGRRKGHTDVPGEAGGGDVDRSDR